MGFSWALKHWADLDIGGMFEAPTEGATLLLLGSGSPLEKKHLEAIGFQVISFDINPRYLGVDVVGDAHRIPLKDASCDCVASFQVLEHLHSPWIAIQEVARILKPGGLFVGSVAFLKEFHQSYFHMTHWGVMSLLEHGGLSCERIYGGQNVFGRLIGSMFRFGSSNLTERPLNLVGKALFQCRNMIWTARNRVSYNRPLARFDRRPMSFKQHDAVKYAPAIMFTARKTMESRA